MRNSPFRILVVEDDPDDRLLIEAELQLQPDLVQGVVVSNSGELSSYLNVNNHMHDENNPPNMVFISAFSQQFALPETLSLFENHPLYHKIPIVILVNSELEKDFVASTQPGTIHSFLVKPVNIEKILESLGIV